MENNFQEYQAFGADALKKTKNDNGLQNLVAYYQSLFDIEENILYYNEEDYQNAKRKFVKYLVKTRTLC